MRNKQAIARQALRGALTLRSRLEISRNSPLCAIDCASRLNIDVWYAGGSSFSGMYDKTSGTILVPALRPIGYQSFTCAHELGHWYFEHGSKVDEIGDFENVSNRDPEEQLANLFAAYFLMPVWAVKKSFEDHGWKPDFCLEVEFYIVSTYLGVGYTTLIEHMYWSLRLITSKKRDHLLKSSPKKIRQSILGESHSNHLVIARECWNGIAIDLRVGDLAILPKDITLHSTSIEEFGSTTGYGTVVIARTPGISRVETKSGSWASYIRVSRKGYRGPSEYRHLEDPDFDEQSNSDQRDQSLSSLGQAISRDYEARA